MTDAHDGRRGGRDSGFNRVPMREDLSTGRVDVVAHRSGRHVLAETLVENFIRKDGRAAPRIHDEPGGRQAFESGAELHSGGDQRIVGGQLRMDRQIDRIG